MKFHQLKIAKEYMNTLGRKGIPFLLITDFELDNIHVIIDFQESKDIKFKIGNQNNYGSTSINKSLDQFETEPISIKEYNSAFQLVMNEIHLGNSFLLNLAFPTKIKTNLSLEDIFFSTSAKYKILVRDNFVCFSPETFIQINDGVISSFPMKGTIDASIPDAQETILADKKEEAEHYTIVDLIRNDISQVAKHVEVKRFRYIDEIETSNKKLLQVSSEISGKLQSDYTHYIGSIITKLLPAGSISGAPKKKTVEIIQKAENRKRGYYTGICALFDGKNLDSGVIIRYLESKEDQLYYKSGGGITFKSNMEEEYNEMLDKVYLPIEDKVMNES